MSSEETRVQQHSDSPLAPGVESARGSNPRISADRTTQVDGLPVYVMGISLWASNSCSAGKAITIGSRQIGTATMPSLTSSVCARPIVKSPDRSPRNCSAEGSSHIRISISGFCKRQRQVSHRGYQRAPSDTAMRRLPRLPAAMALAFSCACSKTVNSRRVSCKNAAPAAVRRVPLRSRSKSTTPSSSSSSLIARDNGGCSICRRSAARVKCNSSANATKQNEDGVVPCTLFLNLKHIGPRIFSDGLGNFSQVMSAGHLKEQHAACIEFFAASVGPQARRGRATGDMSRIGHISPVQRL
ncbi:hypothetical protein RLIN73S_03897 [Rhodanobacter lindaniclasticus]